MGRPPFSPDDEQADTLRELNALAKRIETAERQRRKAVLLARSQAIPIEVIARHGLLTKRTVYRWISMT